MSIEELQVYQLSMDAAEKIWNYVIKWDYFAKDSVGKQFVKAADSISANLSEGYGRYFYKENKQFCYYSRGSLFETKTWLRKSFNRKLIDETNYLELVKIFEAIGMKLKGYIKSIGENPKSNS